MNTGTDPISRALRRLDESELEPEVAAVIRDALTDAGTPEGQPADSLASTEAYLKSITVAGFRGIGPKATIDIDPGPGLTLVVGRNGSGKSSFADAIEFLLTGDTMRWSGRPADWRKGWRNLHADEDTSIEAQFIAGNQSNPLTLHHSWEGEANLDSGTGWAQPAGRQRMSLNELGWIDATRSSRPFLSYSELGNMLEQGPAKLFDAMSKILGLDDLVEIAEVLRQDRLARQKKSKAVAEDLKTNVLPRLSESEDPRAAQCSASLSGRKWDLDAVTDVVGGDLGADSSSDVNTLRSIAAITVPDRVVIADLAAEIRSALEARTSLDDTDAQRAAGLSDLMKRALRFHEDHAETDCPVCGTTGVLDDEWRTRTRASIDELEGQAVAVRNADRKVEQGFKNLRDAVRPPAIDADRLTELDINTARVDDAARILTAELEKPDDGGLLDDVVPAYASYAQELDDLQASAETEANRRDDAWRPVALELARWLDDAIQVQDDGAAIANLQSAEKWIQATANEFRRERFEPIAARAHEVWSQLSLNSNVELSDLVLTGGAKNRKLMIDVAVDGVEGVALGVMSQGELHGLALSLFLPRATLDESPFRFVVIDDPVQAMDPSRVDGLARVLADVAADRQVVVFTHDDRLPEAVKRLRILSTVFEVTRRPGSVVGIRKSLDPAQQALSDAHALARSEDVPDAALRRLVPGFCRTALEAAAIGVVRRRRLNAGQSHAAVEQEFQQATRLTHYLSLALFDDRNRGQDVLPELNKYGRWAGDVFQACNKGVHQGYQGDLVNLAGETTSLVGRIEVLK